MKKNNELQNEIEETLDELGKLANDDNANINEIKQKIQKLKDGTELLSGEFQEDEEENLEPEISIKDKKALYRFVKKIPKTQSISDETIEELSDEEFDKLIRVSRIMLTNHTYSPKNKFDKAYKKKRQKRNKMAKKARQINSQKR